MAVKPGQRGEFILQTRTLSCPELINNTNQSPSHSSEKPESFLGFNHTGRRGRIGRKIKPKTRDDFSTGRIQGWSVSVSNNKNQGGQDLAQELGLDNGIFYARDFWKKGVQEGRIGPFLDCSKSIASVQKAELKVYSRHSREGLRKGSIINEGDSSWVVDDHGENHNSDYHTSSGSHSLIDSTSEFSDFDGDLEKWVEINKEQYREITEADGLEGLRHLMGPLELPKGEKINTNEWVRSDETHDKQGHSLNMMDRKLLEGESVERWNNLGKEVTRYVSEGEGPNLKVGKVGLSWKEIKEAMDSVNLELIENADVKGGKVELGKAIRSTVRKKRGERELHNLQWTIQYDKGGKVKGIGSGS